MGAGPIIARTAGWRFGESMEWHRMENSTILNMELIFIAIAKWRTSSSKAHGIGVPYSFVRKWESISETTSQHVKICPVYEPIQFDPPWCECSHEASGLYPQACMRTLLIKLGSWRSRQNDSKWRFLAEKINCKGGFSIAMFDYQMVCLKQLH